MKPNEQRMAFLLVAVVLIVGVGGVIFVAPILRGGTSAVPTSTGRDTTGLSNIDPARLESIEHRMGQLESILSEIRADLSRIEKSDRRRKVAAAAPNGELPSIAEVLDPADLAAVEILFEDEEVREVLLDAVELAAEERASSEARSSASEAVSEKQRELSTMGEALGLSLYEQDTLDELVSDAQRQHDELSARAAELLLTPGALDDDVRQSYQDLMREKREIYHGRNEALISALGQEKYRAYRNYENQQNKKSELYGNVEAYGLSSQPSNDKKNNDNNKNKNKNQGNNRKR